MGVMRDSDEPLARHSMWVGCCAGKECECILFSICCAGCTHSGEGRFGEFAFPRMPTVPRELEPEIDRSNDSIQVFNLLAIAIMVSADHELNVGPIDSMCAGLKRRTRRTRRTQARPINRTS